MYMNNAVWIITDFLLKFISNILVNVYLARVLGPESYGVIAFFVSIYSIGLVFSKAGLDAYLVKEFSIQKSSELLINSSFTLMLVMGGGFFIASSGFFLFLDSEYTIYLCILSFSLLLQSFSVIEYYCQANLKSKLTAKVKMISVSFSVIFKVLIVYYDLGLGLVIISYSLDVVFFSLIVFCSRKILFASKISIDFSSISLFALLKKSFPFFVTSMSVVLYMKIDQVMLGIFRSDAELGLYSAVAKIYEGLILLPYIITVSLMPMFSRLYDSDNEQMVEWFSVISFIFLFSAGTASMLSFFFGAELLTAIYGEKYAEASTILTIFMVSLIFSSLGSVAARYLTVSGQEMFLVKRTLFALAINFGSNCLVIPIWGGIGAAMSTLISLFFANYLVFLFDKRMHVMRKIMHNSFPVVVGLILKAWRRNAS